jgi:cyclase
MKLGYTVALATAVSLFAATAYAQGQPDFSKVQIKTTPLGNNVYMLEGQGGNVTVAVGDDGVIQVDGEFAPLHDKIKAAVDKVSGGKPIKYLINTHFHGDHTGGNAAFAKDGAIVVGNENVGKRMANPPPGANGQPGTPAPKAALPVQNYSGQGTEVKVAGQAAELVHFENAHTDGDTIVFWPATNVISTGDIVSSTNYPNIDVASGGGIDGMIAGTQFVIDHSDARTKIVPGHGPVTDRKGVRNYLAMLKTARSRIAAAKKKGMSEDDAIKLVADLDKKWAAPGPNPPRFPRLVYQSVK